MKLQERVDELFAICSRSSSIGTADFKSISRNFWYQLDNSVTIVDLAGIFTVCIPANGAEVLTIDIFPDFVKALSRVKYPTDSDYYEKFVSDVLDTNKEKTIIDSLTFTSIMERNVMRTLLKYDIPIRRAYSYFCGQSVRVGGRLNWDEIKSMSIGMEIDGLIAFAGEYSLIPTFLKTEECETLFREVLNRYPLKSNSTSLNSTILYPQFQFLLVKAAIDVAHHKDIASNKSSEARPRPVSDLLNDLLRDIGINKSPESNNDSLAIKGGGNRELQPDIYQNSGGLESSQMLNYSPKKKSVSDFFSGTVVKPSSSKPQDMYTSSGNHSRQAMMLRMEHLFDEMEAKLLQRISPDDAMLQIVSNFIEEVLEVKAKLPSKPVVIGDAIPCPQEVQQLLEAALAHHNLGSFEEALKFLEASSIQLTDVLYRNKEVLEHRKSIKVYLSPALHIETDYFDLEMYILLCKGNVYQSCGDDEQSLLHYMEAFSKAHHRVDKDWEVISFNSIGMLAYFNLRYDVALLCFHTVAIFREATYGIDNADTATAWNNEACCLYCLNKKGEARLKFERSWTTLSNTIGHRSPRSVTTWKNLEKARRCNTSMNSKSDVLQSIQMRSDADRLLIGGTFTIQALPPLEGGGGGKKKGKGKKKKK